MSKTEFQHLAREMKWRIYRFALVALQIFHNQIKQTAARLKNFAIKDELQAGVEIAVMAQAPFNVLGPKFRLFEDFGIGLKSNEGAVRLVGRFAFLIVLEFALL